MEKLRGLLAFANPYAADFPVELPAAHPSEFKAETPPNLPRFDGRWDDYLHTAAVAAALAKDPAPIPAVRNRENNQEESHFAYWLRGFAEFRQIESLASKHGGKSGRVFDFGGSTGRIFRHFLYQSSDWEVWSNDFKRSSVEWNLRYFVTPRLIAFQGSYLPVLPIEDNYFDLILAMSVFTHIDETETGWLLELRRVLRPGGLALLTIHNDDTWANMPPHLADKFFAGRPDLRGREAMPEGRHVSNWRQDDPYRCNVFHSNGYVRKHWGRCFRLLEIVPKFMGYRAVAVLQKP
jgi:SAM-dependent methyltransferase